MLLNAVDVQYNNRAEGVVLREPKRAEDLAALEDVIDNAHDAHSGFEAVVDIGVDSNHDAAIGCLFVSRASVYIGERGEVGQQEGAMHEQHGVVVGQIEDIALALVERNQQRRVYAFGIEEAREAGAPFAKIVGVLCGELDAQGH